MQPLTVVAQAHGGAKEFAEPVGGQQVATRAVGKDAPVAHEQQAIHLRKNVGQVMGDEDDADAVGCQLAECLAEFALGGDVERVGRLIEQQLARTMDERTGDEDAALFSGRHFADQTLRQVGGIDAGKCLPGGFAHFAGDDQMGPERGGGKEAGQRGIQPGGAPGEAACGVCRAGVTLMAGKIVGDDAKVAAKLGEIPAVAAKDAQLGFGANERVEFAGEGADECGFAAAVGAEDDDVFAGLNGQGEIVQHDAIAECDVDVAHFQKGFVGDGYLGNGCLGSRVSHFVRVNGMSDLTRLVIPGGFRFAATTAGLKASGRPDFAVIVADKPASAAALYTANKVCAAPLVVDREHMAATGGWVRAVAINAGNANCATGQAGLEAARQVCAAVAERFGCSEQEVFPSSTGIIGVPLPAQKLVDALEAVEAGLGADAEQFHAAAQAILTTDTVEKTAFARVGREGSEVRIAGFCKGAGMIHPQLVPHATMLAYMLTDAAVEPWLLQQMLQRAVERSFNRISIDGDTSTNDTVLMLASGAGGAKVEAGDAEFEAALQQVMISLARQIVADGEGVRHVVELRIEGAASDADALLVAKAIAHSPLVKTAWAGCDPNWGRLMAAIGYSGAEIAAERVAIDFGELPICRNGGRAEDLDMAAAHAYLQQPEFSITVRLGLGEGACTFWTSDLTAEYVRINADYST